jgi:hypothetical protein
MNIKKPKRTGLNNELQNTNTVQNDPSKRLQMIALSAYFRAEKRHFAPTNDLADWFASEQEVDRHLSSFSS